MNLFILFVYCLLIIYRYVSASVGDRLPYFRNCVHNCYQIDETNDCNYKCIWKTVNFLQARGLDIPQFYGRWPIIKIFNIEEPASALFSLSNGLMHIKYFQKFRTLVSQKHSFFWPYTLFSIININAWFWSTIFHTKNTYFTELMDYSCAFSIIIFSCFLMIFRVFHDKMKGLKLIFFTTFSSSIFIHYVNSMSQKIDYGFNMLLNIVIGMLTSIGWILWYFLTRANQQTYKKKILYFIFLTSFALSLEIFDFLPFFWTFDAHSLWHLATVFTTPIFYEFIVEDCQYFILKKQN